MSDFPPNTGKVDAASGLSFLATARTLGSDFAIESQEMLGKHDLLRSQALPTSRRGDFEGLGFTFGEVNPQDPIFQQATLPEGWTKDGSSGGSYWSYLVDERGIQRVAIFYKAAFYDRSAHASVINVGYDVASKFIYGDDETFVPNPLLTDSEREEGVLEARRYLEGATDFPGIYGDRAPRAQQVLEVLS